MLAGSLTVQLRDRDVVPGPQDVLVVPRGARHRPRADGEAHLLLVERSGTVDTGDAGGDLTSPLRELP